MGKTRIVASACDGDPLVAHVVTPPGCLAQTFASARRWLVRALLIGAAFAAGYACRAAGG